MIQSATVVFTWSLAVEKEVRTFKDKVGITTMTLGMAFILLSILVFASWFFTPPPFRSQINIIRPLVVLVFSGIGLIRLSFYTVKKVTHSS